MMSTWNKYPNEKLDYAFDFSATLEDGETITAQTVTTQTGLTVSDISQAAGVVKFWLEGGVSGTYYLVDCTVTTSAGRIDVEEEVIYVR